MVTLYLPIFCLPTKINILIYFLVYLIVFYIISYRIIQEAFVLIDRQRGMCIRYTDLL